VDRKVLLNIVLGLVALILCAFAAVATMYLLPAEEAKESSRVRISISSIPLDGYKEVEWKARRVFLIRGESIRAYSIPHFQYEAGVYGLPDPVWERPFTFCSRMIYRDKEFSCADSSWSAEAKKVHKWNAQGQSIGAAWLPPLPELKYVVVGDEIVIGPRS
jgi:hypothetical protein